MERFDPAHPMLQGVDGDEIAETGDSLLDYVTAGTASAAVSGVVGTVNSLMGVANLVGADFDYIDERSTIQDSLGQGTAEFYDRHKEGVDAVGFVASMLIPGTAAVKAMRTAQTSGRLTAGVTAATGLANGDIVLGSAAVQAARSSVLSTARYNGTLTNMFTNEAKRSAVAAGFKQNALEAAVFEGVAMLTTTQNSSLNAEHLDTATSGFNTLKENWGWMLGGAAVGGVLDVFRIRGNLATTFRAEEQRVLTPLMEGLRGWDKNLPLGDQLTILANNTKRVAGMEEAASPLGQEFLAGTKSQLEQLSIKLRGNENKTIAQFVTDAIASDTPEVLLAGLQNVRNMTVQESENYFNWAIKRAAPAFISSSETASGFAFDWINAAERSRGRALSGAERLELQDAAGAWFGNVGNATMSAVPGPSGIGRVAVGTRPIPMTVQGQIGTLGRGVIQSKSWDDLYSDYSRGVVPKLKAYGIPVPKFEEWRTGVILHELGHTTSNSQRLSSLVNNLFSQSKSLDEVPPIVQQLVAVSAQRRGPRMNEAIGQALDDLQATGLSPQKAMYELLKTQGAVLAGDRGQSVRYLLNTREILADAAAMIADPKTAEWASKFAPDVAAMFRQYGGLAMPWQPRRGYYDALTKTVKTSALAGINDLKPGLRAVREGKSWALRGDGVHFAETDAIFSLNQIQKELDSGTSRLDYMLFSKAHALAGLKKLEDFAVEKLDSGESVYLLKSKNDIANGERLAALTEEGALFRYGANDQMVDRKQLLQDIQAHKETIRLKLSGQADVYSPEEIEHITNVKFNETLGLEGTDYFLQPKQDWSTPRQVVTEYTRVNPEGVDDLARSLPTINMRTEVLRAEQTFAAAEVLGKKYNDLPAEIGSSVSTISQTDQFGGMLAQTRSRFGSALESLQYVGKVTTDIISNARQTIEDGFQPYYAKLNRTDARVDRAELAVAENWARRGHSRAIETDNGYFLYREEVVSAAKEQARLNNIDDWEQFVPSLLDESNSLRVRSQTVADFIDFHIEQNDGYLAQSKTLAKARGQHMSGVAGRFYVPPRDLKDERYFGFVVPSEAASATDSGKYMVFGRSQEELDSKIALIKRREGSRYKVVSAKEATQYKQLIGEYDKGRVFDELQFDSSLQKAGTSSELIPNMDVNGSSSLERFRRASHMRSEALIRSAVELQYAPTFAQLELLGEQFGRFEEGKLAFGFLKRERDNAYTKARNLALGIRGHDGPTAYLWKSVNDMVGENAGRIIDAGMRTFSQKARLTESDFNSINQMVEKSGVMAPFREMSELLIASTDSTVSRTAPTLVRTFNNLVATGMLRLDFLNNIVQTISTPILALPVLREAMQELAGTERAALMRAITVNNPASGGAEPTAQKLLMNSIKTFWSQDGQARLREYQDRGLIPDFLHEYREAMDFSELTGSHTLQKVNDVLDRVGRVGGKITGHQKAEAFSRFMVADAARQIAELRGMEGDEVWAVMSSAIDKVHGIYRHSQRANLFNGVIGQAIGLYQTYTFNFMQNALRHLETGDKGNLAMIAGLQGSMFGIRSFPGFQTLNAHIAEVSNGREDIYNYTGADDPKNSFANYLVYGLGSHSLGVPVDLYTRGDMAPRNALIVPTSFSEIPAVSIIARGAAAMTSTATLLASGDVSVGQAMMHGVAHNGMNRPLQGLATIAQGYVSDRTAKPLFLNTNHVDFDLAQDFNYSAGFARILGGKPYDEGVLLDNYYRTKQYQSVTKQKIMEVSTKINLAIADGTDPTPDEWQGFMMDYERAGGRVENFNAYATRAMSTMGKSAVMELRDKMQERGASRRAYTRMLLETKPIDFAEYAPGEISPEVAVPPVDMMNGA